MFDKIGQLSCVYAKFNVCNREEIQWCKKNRDKCKNGSFTAKM